MHDGTSNVAIGIDLGGTSTRAAVVDSSGSVLARIERPTDREESVDQIVRRLADDVARLLVKTGGESECGVRIGLAVPGPLDRTRTKLLRCVNLPSLENTTVGAELAAQIRTNVSLWTDAEAATWGEYIARQPRAQRFVHLRLGTGVACGVVIDGKLQRLDAERETHLDVLVVDHKDGALPCVCGLRGCLETVASGKALLRSASRLEIGPTLAFVQHVFDGRDKHATDLVEGAARAVTIAIENLTRRYRPEVICLGGGVCQHLPALREAVQRLTIRSPLPIVGRPGPDDEVTGDANLPDTGRMSLESARLGADSGIIGAAALARDARASVSLFR